MKRTALSFLALLLLAPPAGAADLTVRVTGGAEGEGVAMISVFAAEADWMQRPADGARVGFGPGGTAEAALTAPAGPVAVSVWWDRDGDGALDRNLFGIPTEAFGFSNGASAPFGPPGWEKAVFALPEAGGAVEIRLETAD